MTVHTKQQYFTLSSFQNFGVPQGSSNQSLKNYGFICDAIFFTCMHARQVLNSES